MRATRLIPPHLYLALLAAGLGAAQDLVYDLHGEDRGLGQLMAGQWRCLVEDIVTGRRLARSRSTPSTPSCYPDVTVHLYSGWPSMRKVLDVRRPDALAGWLRWTGWDPRRRVVVLVHGFNGGLEKAPLADLRDAFLERAGHYVLVLDWSPLARYPCYADAVRHSRTAAWCGAQALAALGAAMGDDTLPTTCVGHSLGAHICGMMSRQLPRRLYKVVALDAARPRVARLLGDEGLSPTDAWVVQSFHTNMGFYGEYPGLYPGQPARQARPVGALVPGRSGRQGPQGRTASFCLNGGRIQPHCRRGSRFARMRCSHFLSVCYFTQLVRGRARGGVAVPCDQSCDRLPGAPPFAVKLTEPSADRWRGTYCLDLDLDMQCRIDV